MKDFLRNPPETVLFHSFGGQTVRGLVRDVRAVAYDFHPSNGNKQGTIHTEVRIQCPTCGEKHWEDANDLEEDREETL